MHLISHYELLSQNLTYSVILNHTESCIYNIYRLYEICSIVYVYKWLKRSKNLLEPSRPYNMATQVYAYTQRGRVKSFKYFR